MSIPLDNLYNWVESKVPGPIAVYLFHPHGHKNISNIRPLRFYDLPQLMPAMLMHDQEPLNYQLYDNIQQCIPGIGPLAEKVDQSIYQVESSFDQLIKQTFPNLNLHYIPFLSGPRIYDNIILVHSETNSVDLERYKQDGYVCVYYWSHAVIARDWYRFAKHDARLQNKNPSKDFLIYCRDWSDRREYRLKFVDLLIENNLHKQSQVSIMKTNSSGQHYKSYEFVNQDFKINNVDKLEILNDNTCTSSSSADYNYEDYCNTRISVVLETEFDSSRIHLTEKILRPIACRHPFILAAGPGSLEYLKHYGFKTFGDYIDESYDQEKSSLARMEKIIQSMKQTSTLTNSNWQQIQKIADYNQQYFFSDKFFEKIESELISNLTVGYHAVKNTKGQKYLTLLAKIKNQNPDLLSMQYQNYDMKLVRKLSTQLLRQLR